MAEKQASGRLNLKPENGFVSGRRYSFPLLYGDGDLFRAMAA